MEATPAPVPSSDRRRSVDGQMIADYLTDNDIRVSVVGSKKREVMARHDRSSFST
jgi:hypothetical protein